MSTTTTWKCWRVAEHPVGTSRFGWPQCTVCRAAPAYHERPRYLSEDLELPLFVTKSPLLLGFIAPRSAIVGDTACGNRLTVYYEGWVNGPMQYADRDARGLWEAGIEHAAGRMVTDYPTSALATPRLEDLTQVGTYHVRSKTVTVTDEDALAKWLA